MEHSIFAKVLHQPNVIFAQTINSAVNQFCRTVPLCTLNMPYCTVNKLNAIWCIYHLLTRKKCAKYAPPARYYARRATQTGVLPRPTDKTDKNGKWGI